MTFPLGMEHFQGRSDVLEGYSYQQGDLAVMNGNHETKRIRCDVFISGEQRISFFEGRSFNQNGGKMCRFVCIVLGGWDFSRYTCHNYIGEDVHLHQVTCWQLGILASMTSTYITSMVRTVRLFVFSHCFFSNKNFPKLCKVQSMSCPNTVSSRRWPISVKWGWFSQL